MPKKSVKKQKAYQQMLGDQARKGYINKPDGTWMSRGNAEKNSMQRDFYPQRLA